MIRFIICVILLTALLFITTATPDLMVYRNARIYTMDPSNPVASALLVKNGRVMRVGSDDLLTLPEASGAATVDLNNRVVLPGFVDAHSHFPGIGLKVLGPNLRPPPLGAIDSVQALLSELARAEASLADDRWLLGFNYDNTVFASGLHPTRAQLDEISATRPIYLWHQSGHMGVANSAALEALGFQNDSPAVPGGELGRDPVSGALNGLLQEAAAPSLTTLLETVPKSELLKVLKTARDRYLAAGVTTVQDGFAGSSQIQLWRWAQQTHVLPQRVVVWPAHQKLGGKLLNPIWGYKSDEKFHFGPVKIIADGSPQGLTAYLTKPYFGAVSNGLPADYRGFPSRESAELIALVEQYHSAGFNLAVHGNGDAAIDDILDAVENAQTNHPRADARHVVVHAQTVRRDQIQRMSELNVSASFFVSHTYFWGEWHKARSLGPERASNISPTAWADEHSVRYTLHTDAPVTPIDPWQLIWSAVERKTLKDDVLGSSQRISVDRALRAVTIDAAWQSGMEASVGSLNPGKLADFIVLSEDPYDIADVRDAKVLFTVIGGVVRYTSEE